MEQVRGKAKRRRRFVQHDGEKDDEAQRSVAFSHGCAKRNAVHGRMHDEANERRRALGAAADKTYGGASSDTATATTTSCD